MTAAHIRLGEGTPPAPSAGEGILYFDDSDQQLYVIDAAGATVGPIGGGGGIAAANVLYVQTLANGGNDATAARGDSAKPYATISAALGDAQNGDVILLGVGNFLGPGSVYAANATLKDVAIIGQGQKATSISSSGGEVFSLVYASPPLNLVEWEQFVLARLTIIGGNGTNPIVIDGSAAAGALWFPNPGTDNRFGACLFDVDLSTTLPGGAVSFRNCGYVRLERVRERSFSDALELSVVNNAELIARDVVISTVTDGLDFAAPAAPPTGCIGSTYEGCSFASAAKVAGQSRSRWIDCTFYVFRDDKLLFDAPSTQSPQIVAVGGSAALVDFTINKIPDAPANMLFDFAGMAIGSVSAEVKAPALNRQTFTLRGCSISNTATANDGIDMDARSSSFSQRRAFAFVTSLGPVGGAIRPPMFDLPVVALPPGPPPAGALLTFGFTLYQPFGYVVLLESDTVAAGNLAAVNKTTTDVTCVASIGAGAGNVTGVVYVL